MEVFTSMLDTGASGWRVSWGLEEIGKGMSSAWHHPSMCEPVGSELWLSEEPAEEPLSSGSTGSPGSSESVSNYMQQNALRRFGN